MTFVQIAATIEARQAEKSSQGKEAADKYLEDLKRGGESCGEALSEAMPGSDQRGEKHRRGPRSLT